MKVSWREYFRPYNALFCCFFLVGDWSPGTRYSLGNVCKVGGAKMIFSSFLSIQRHRTKVKFCQTWRNSCPLCPHYSRASSWIRPWFGDDRAIWVSRFVEFVCRGFEASSVVGGGEGSCEMSSGFFWGHLATVAGAKAKDVSELGVAYLHEINHFLDGVGHHVWATNVRLLAALFLYEYVCLSVRSQCALGMGWPPRTGPLSSRWGWSFHYVLLLGYTDE